MRMHARWKQVELAEIDLGRFVNEWIEKHDLTYLEAIGALLTETLSLKKYALRMERHPDEPDKKGDEA